MKTLETVVGYLNLGGAAYHAFHSNYSAATFFLLWYVIFIYLGDKE